jgi:hypothetical protein
VLDDRGNGSPPQGCFIHLESRTRLLIWHPLIVSSATALAAALSGRT